jgi:uncharacterized lipoprotein
MFNAHAEGKVATRYTKRPRIAMERLPARAVAGKLGAMKTIASLLVLAFLVTALPAAAVEPVSHTFSAPIDRVWTTTEHLLKQLGWDIDKADRSIGWMTTESRRVEGQGEDWGVYAKGTRHRLTITMKPAGDKRTSVAVERTVFKRERILWVDKDEPVAASDQKVEKDLIDAIERAL